MKINKKIMIFGLVIVAIILVGTAVGIRVGLIEDQNMNNTPSLDDDNLIVNDIVFQP